jgi:hypothetical protein
MTKYSNYKFKNFISDKTFYNYARGLNKDDVETWETWMNKKPENKDDLDKKLEEILNI